MLQWTHRERLARARWAVEEHAFWRCRTGALKQLRVHQRQHHHLLQGAYVFLKRRGKAANGEGMKEVVLALFLSFSERIAPPGPEQEAVCVAAVRTAQKVRQEVP